MAESTTLKRDPPENPSPSTSFYSPRSVLDDLPASPKPAKRRTSSIRNWRRDFRRDVDLRRSPWDVRGALNGFPRFSKVLAADPSKSSIMFKRFDGSSIRNLLLLEARVAALERLRDVFDKEERRHVVETMQNKTANEPRVDEFQTISQSWEDFALLGSFATRVPEVKVASKALGKEGSEEAEEMLRRAEYWEPLRGEDIDRHEEFPWFALNIWAFDRRELLRYQGFDTDPKNLDEWSEGEARADPDKFLGRKVPDLGKIQDRWRLAKLTESAIKEYQEALIRHHQLLQIQQPADRTFKAIKDWFTPPGDGRGRGSQFIGSMGDIFNDSKATERIPEKARLAKHDFVALGRTGGEDPISRFVATRGGLFSSRLFRNKYYSGGEVNYVSENVVANLSIMIGLFIAMVFLVGAVWTLWGADHDSNPAVALGVLSAWVFIFGFAINYGTDASNDQVLGATAAYAAVLVVFVGQQFGVSATQGSGAGGGNASSS